MVNSDAFEAMAAGASFPRTSFSERKKLMTNALNRRLLDIMEKKKTCLCLAIDYTNSAKILETLSKAAPYICAVKLHVDILVDFSEKFVAELSRLAGEAEFLVFEDRKFADTGNTVELQATAGLFKISSWAHTVTVHALPGEPILAAFRRVMQQSASKLQGCLLISELSTKGALTNTEEYRKRAFQLASENKDVVCGFICQRRPSRDESFLYWTPGVNLNSSTDGCGQQWRTVDEAIVRDGNDIVIVGRALTAAANFEAEIVRYRNCGWKALLAAVEQRNAESV